MGVREVDTGRALTLRGTASVVRLRPAGTREAAEVPGVMSFVESAD